MVGNNVSLSYFNLTTVSFCCLTVQIHCSVIACLLPHIKNAVFYAFETCLVLIMYYDAH